MLILTLPMLQKPQNLHDIENLEIIWTPAVAAFLARQLSRVIQLRSFSTQKWTKKRITSYINGSLEIEGTISETTIGRFLNSGHKQKASEKTLKTCAVFLIHFGYISVSQLQWAESSPSVKAGLSLKSYYDIKTSQSNIDFWRKISGEYIYEKVNGSFLLRCNLTIEYIDEAQMLIASEQMELFDLSIKLDKSFDALTYERNLEKAKLLSVINNGPIIASDDLFCTFFRSDSSHSKTLLPVQSIIFNDNDEIIGFKCQRNRRWKVQNKDNLELPEVIRANMRNIDILGIIGSYPQFMKVDYESNFALKRLNDNNTKKPTKLDFYQSSKTNEAMERTEIARIAFDQEQDIDKRLQIALDYGDLMLFREALKLGADPNYKLTPTDEEPMLFGLVANGNEAWVDAILEYDDVYLGVNSHGLRPSNIAYFTGQPFSQSGITTNIAEKFTRMEEKLYKRELDFDEKLNNNPRTLSPKT